MSIFVFVYVFVAKGGGGLGLRYGVTTTSENWLKHLSPMSYAPTTNQNTLSLPKQKISLLSQTLYYNIKLQYYKTMQIIKILHFIIIDPLTCHTDRVPYLHDPLPCQTRTKYTVLLY